MGNEEMYKKIKRHLICIRRSLFHDTQEMKRERKKDMQRQRDKIVAPHGAKDGSIKRRSIHSCECESGPSLPWQGLGGTSAEPTSKWSPSAILSWWEPSRFHPQVLVHRQVASRRASPCFPAGPGWPDRRYRFHLPWAHVPRIQDSLARGPLRLHPKIWSWTGLHLCH